VNAVKHARGDRIAVRLGRSGTDVVELTVRDDGVGGATLRSDGGLQGLRDRVTALGGNLGIDSPPGGGTTIVARLPIEPVPIISRL
jgi:signal transduction histidine kinase